MPLTDKTRVRQEPHCCPVCRGRGMVNFDFYTNNHAYDGIGTSSSISPVWCRRCDGKGVIWEPRQVEARDD